MKSKHIYALIASAALLPGLPGGVDAPEPTPAPRTVCTSDILFPVDLQLVLLDAPAPGGVVRVRVAIETRVPLDAAELTVFGPPDLPVAAGRRASLGALLPGQGAAHEFTLILPPDRSRRTVDVRFEAPTGQGSLVRGATLNLNFEEEASRVVAGPGGIMIREVAARRID